MKASKLTLQHINAPRIILKSRKFKNAVSTQDAYCETKHPVIIQKRMEECNAVN